MRTRLDTTVLRQLKPPHKQEYVTAEDTALAGAQVLPPAVEDVWGVAA